MTMFKRRDIPPVLLLLLLIILVMLTLSQILVVHNGRYGRNVHNMRKLQLELREMDINLHSLMLQNVPSIELNRRLLQNEINAVRIKKIIAEAAKTSHRPHRKSRLPVREAMPPNSASSEETTNGSLDMEQPSSDILYQSSLLDELLGNNSRNNTQNRRLHPLQNAQLKSDNQALTNNDRTVLSSLSLTDSNITGVQSDHNWRRLDNSYPTMFPSQSTSRTDVTTKPLLQYCPSIPPGLSGKVFVNLIHSHNSTEEEIVRQNPNLLPGGNFRPHGCVARHKVAVVIPYRDRKEHLMMLLSHLHPILQRQQLDYTVIVVEQYGSDTFNKARIMNIAFVEGLKLYGYQCFVFHDVDLVPEDDRNMYSCPLQPRHMSVAIDEMGYKLAYQELVGGVLNLRTEHFTRVNGYSNLYWGWGAEDDDMAYRIMHVGLKITRPPETVARYKMVKHRKRKPADWRKRAKLLYTGTRRFQFDGLNSLQYKVVRIEKRKLFTHMLVDIGKPPRGF